MNNIGLKIKEIRINQKITQPELASKIGVAKSMISQWENLKNEPKASYIVKLANTLQVSTDYLLGVENEEGMIVMTNELSNSENHLIDVLRKLPEKEKNTIYDLVDLMDKAYNK